MLDLGQRFTAVPSFPSRDASPPPESDTPIAKLNCVQGPPAKPDLSFDPLTAAPPTVVKASFNAILESPDTLAEPSKAKWLKYSMTGATQGAGDYTYLTLDSTLNGTTVQSTGDM